MTDQNTGTNSKTEKAGSAEQQGGNLGAAIGTVRDRASDGLGAVRAGASSAFETARDKAASAYSTAREAAAGAGEKAVGAVDENPLGALIGGIALGAVVGALLPRSDREVAALAPLGGKLRDLTATATKAAKANAVDKLADLGLSGDLVSKAKGLLEPVKAKTQEAADA